MIGTVGLALVAVIMFAAPTVSWSSNEKGPDYLVPQPLPEGSEVIDGDPPAQFQTPDTVPDDVARALLDLSVTRSDLRIAGTEWIATEKRVVLYSAASQDLVAKALDEAGVSDRVSYASARLDAEQKAELGQAIAGKDGHLPSGHRVVSVTPALDGRTATVALDENVAPDKAVALPALRSYSDVELTVVFSAPIEPALRNHAPTPSNPLRYGGALMVRSGTGVSCSTGFRMTQIVNSEPVMGSAHHCFNNDEGQAWQYSSMTGAPGPYSIGNAHSAVGPGLSAGDVAVWRNPSSLSYMMPGVFAGDHTVAGSGVYAIKGAYASSVNAVVCYSGSYSGTVCNSQIVATGITVCYGAPYPCYSGIARTVQPTGTPVAGNGDSGGPVYATNSGLYAVGIISGINNGTSECMGEPGGPDPDDRKCSSVAYYAPITELFVYNYGLNYVP